jgi:mannose-1-phosphate guanylyltransferase
LYALTRSHREFYGPELEGAEPWQFIEQPLNRGTLAAVAYSLVRLRSVGAEGVVGLFPSDHYYRDTAGLAATIRAAYEQGRRDPDSLVLLGAEATRPETDYGWIEPGVRLKARRRPLARALLVRGVQRFHEKPPIDLALDLFARGCLWNTLIVIGQIRTFESLLATTAPDLWRDFSSLGSVATPEEELAISHAIYQTIDSWDFSRDALAALPRRLSVMALPDVGWTDMGHPLRVAEVLADRREVLMGPRLAC